MITYMLVPSGFTLLYASQSPMEETLVIHNETYIYHIYSIDLHLREKAEWKGPQNKLFT